MQVEPSNSQHRKPELQISKITKEEIMRSKIIAWVESDVEDSFRTVLPVLPRTRSAAIRGGRNLLDLR
jgi:hypothetical protein